MMIIADIGSNFHSSEDLFRSIKICSICGADVFKIQYFEKKKRYDLDEIAAVCSDEGLEFMASVFEPEDVEVLNPYVHRWKIASCEAKHFPLLRMVATTNKPVIVSTGGYDYFDHVFSIFKPEQVTLLACEATYPARHIDLTAIQHLRDMYHCEVGLSDHSADVFTTAWAAQKLYKVELVERHVNPLSLSNTPDCGDFALKPRDFYDYCHFLKTGNHSYEHTKKHLPTRKAMVMKSIHPGDRLEYGVNWSFERCIGDCENDFFDENDGVMFSMTSKIEGSILHARDIGI